MNGCSLGIVLAVCSVAISAEETAPCTALAGAALDRCQVNLQQQQLTQQQQLLIQLQQQLAQQQEQLKQQQSQLAKQQQQILEQQEQSRRSEMLSRQMEHASTANPSAASGATDYTSRAEVKSWKVDNAWFGSDYRRTQFAMHYAKQLQQERPELLGRPFLDAISAKVKDTFGDVARP